MRRVSKRRRLLVTSWTVQAREFFVNSTLHGVRYIAGDDRPFIEKFMWFCCTSMGMVAALIIIVSLWEKFQTNPTLTGLDTDFHNWDVAFPALTVCQNDPSNQTLVHEYVDKHWKGASETQRAYYAGFLIALANMSFQSLPALQPYLQDSTLPQGDLKQVVYEIVSRCHVLTECIWKGEEVGELECCPFFYPIFTENGFCYAFNLRFNETEWPFEFNRRERFSKYYIEETDLQWSMSINTDDATNNTVEVYITSSDDVPGYETIPQHAWTRRISLLSFASKETYTTTDARQLSIRQRRCVYDDEIKLLTDSKYTYSACMRECRMQLAHKLCGCLPPFYAPIVQRLQRQKDQFRYCRLKELSCIIKHIDMFNASQLECPCELGCKHAVYDMQKLQEAGADDDALEIGFVSWPMVRYKREVLFGWSDLMVAFGGIAGLFLGFSLLSGVEIIYYFTLRAWCMVYRDREHLERLAEEYERAEMQKPNVDLSLKPSFMKESTSEQVVGGFSPGGGRVHPLLGETFGRPMVAGANSHGRRRSIPRKKGWPLPYLP